MDILKEYEMHYTLILRRIVTKNFIRKKKHRCKKVTSLAFVSSSYIQPFLLCMSKLFYLIGYVPFCCLDFLLVLFVVAFFRFCGFNCFPVRVFDCRKVH